jgi:hypothetical protein
MHSYERDGWEERREVHGAQVRRKQRKKYKGRKGLR